jgi:Leucine-rich repeat (LRR) protein
LSTAFAPEAITTAALTMRNSGPHHDVTVKVQTPVEVDVDEAMAAWEAEANLSIGQVHEPNSGVYAMHVISVNSGSSSSSSNNNNNDSACILSSLRTSAIASHHKLEGKQSRQAKIDAMAMAASHSRLNSRNGNGTQSRLDSTMDPPTRTALDVDDVLSEGQQSEAQHDHDQRHEQPHSPLQQQQDESHSIYNAGTSPSMTSPPFPVEAEAYDELLDADVTVVVQNEENRNHHGPKVAHEARLTDFLENRNLQVTLGGVLCLVLVGAAIAATSIVLTTSAKGSNTPPTTTITTDPDMTAGPIISFLPSMAPTSRSNSTSSPTVTTISPTTMPTTKPLLVNLPDYTIKALQDPRSPQSMAYNWLEQHPSLDKLEEWQMHQYMAIISIYYSTNGPASWPDDGYKRNALSYNTSVCNWLPTTTTTSGSQELGACRDSSDRVTHLTLRGLAGGTMTSHLHGTMPPEVALLSWLEEFRVVESDLVQRTLAAFWPLQLSTLPNLRKIEFYANNLKGSIPAAVLTPPQLAQQLTFLSLASNTVLAGSLPTELGLLTSLQNLYLEFNSFTSSIPSEIGNLVQLQALRLYQNGLTGTVPLEVTTRLTRLENLWLERNDLTGTLPSDLCIMNPSLAAGSRVRLDCGELPCPSNCNCSCGG